ncbi:MAG: magnesium transporter [Candidatus Protochlamydia sp.]|nr:magnesium transporter [Candidatus Protochlamydia sp.]
MTHYDYENLQDKDSEIISELIDELDHEQLQKTLKTIPAFKIAALISEQGEERQAFIFRTLELPLSFEVFDFLSLRIQKNLLSSIPNTHTAYLLNELSPDDRTAFLQGMPGEKINELIKYLPHEERAETLTLLGYPEGSVGRLMTPDYIAIQPEWTIQAVLDYLVEYGHDSETISLVYVVDEQGKLLDDIKLRDFLFVPRNQQVSSLMDGQYVALSVDNNDEQAISEFLHFDRVALPVTDQRGILLGIVTIDDILRLSDKEATEDIQKMGGQEALDEPYMETPFLSLMKKRAGWLVILFVGEMLTATALAYFENEIAAAVVLALFLPLIISSGGNAGGQATTLIVRALALGEVRPRDWWRVMRREMAAGVFLGLILGIVGFTRIAIWSQFSNIYGEHWILIGFTIFFSLVGVVIWGTLTGALFPILLRALGIDPATSSAPFVATVVDVIGIVIYFLIASIILSGTVL